MLSGNMYKKHQIIPTNNKYIDIYNKVVIYYNKYILK